jgi:hypothetical protein
MTVDLTEREGRRLVAPQDASGGQVRPCGDCSLCCKVLAINVLDKAAGQWCGYFRKGVGCTVHGSAPAECQRFQCFWTVSGALGDEWRPDKSKLVLWSNVENRLIVEVDPAFPNAWRREPFYGQLKTWSDRDRVPALEVLVRTAGRIIVVFPEADLDLGPNQSEASIDSGYRVEAGRKIPYAAFVEPHAA